MNEHTSADTSILPAATLLGLVALTYLGFFASILVNIL